MGRLLFHLPDLFLVLCVLSGLHAAEGNEDDLRRACTTIFHEPEVNGASLRFNFSFGGTVRPRRELLKGEAERPDLWPAGIPPGLVPAPQPGGVPSQSPVFSCFLVFAVGPTRTRVRDTRILLQVSDLRLPPGARCTGDTAVVGAAGDAVRVYSVLRGRLFLVREFCENDNYAPAIITESHMAVVTITFAEAQADRRARGFALKVEAYTNIFETITPMNSSDKLTIPGGNVTNMYDEMKPNDKEHEWNLLSQQSWGSGGFHPYIPSGSAVTNFGSHSHGNSQADSANQLTDGYNYGNGPWHTTSHADTHRPTHTHNQGSGFINGVNDVYPSMKPPQKYKQPGGWGSFNNHNSGHAQNAPLPANAWTPLPAHADMYDYHPQTAQQGEPGNSWNALTDKIPTLGTLTESVTGYKKPQNNKHSEWSTFNKPNSGRPAEVYLPTHPWSSLSDNTPLGNPHHAELTQHGKPGSSWNHLSGQIPTWDTWTGSGNKNPQDTKYSGWSTLHGANSGRPANDNLPVSLSDNTPLGNPHHAELTQHGKPGSSWNHLSGQIPTWGTWTGSGNKNPQDTKYSGWSTLHGANSGRPANDNLPVSLSDNTPLGNPHHAELTQHGKPGSSWNHLSGQIPTWGTWTGSGNKNPQDTKYSGWSTLHGANSGRPANDYLPPLTWSPMFDDANFNTHNTEIKHQEKLHNSWDASSNDLHGWETFTASDNGNKWESATHQSGNDWKVYTANGW